MKKETGVRSLLDHVSLAIVEDVKDRVDNPLFDEGRKQDDMKMERIRCS